MKLETIVKITTNGDVDIPSDMEIGNVLMNMIKQLRENGWRTFKHHDNWIKEEYYPNPTSEQQFDTANAYKEMLKIIKDKENEMLPCPFCGGKAEVVSSEIPSYNSKKHYLFYPSCSGVIRGNCPGIVVEQDEQGGSCCDCKTKEEAVTLWNKRV